MTTIILSVCGAAIKLAGYGRYFLGIRRGEMRPNMATWTLWTVLSSLNSASYLVLSGDPLKASVALAGTTGCLITYAYALRRGSMQALSSWDGAALGIGLAAGGSWILSHDAGHANLILQAGFLISMIPTYRGLMADHDAEKPLPWLLMSAAYATNVMVVASRYDGNWITYVYPLLNMITHGGVGLLAMTYAKELPLPKHPHPPQATPPLE